MINIFGMQITFFQVFATIIGIGFLVFIHELGHFLMAKKFRIRVEKFTFGFGPEIIGYTYGETRYSICWIPLGGMVKMPGENIEEATGTPDEFLSQPWYRRLIIAFFGPLMNYILAIILFAIVIYTWGFAKPSVTPFIGEVVPDYPAYEAGLKANDKILKVNSYDIKGWKDLSDIIHKYPDIKISMAIERDQKIVNIDVTPKKDPVSGVGVIGIVPKFENFRAGLGESILMGTKMVIFQSVYTLKYLGEKLIKFEKPELAGPIGVIQILANAAKNGWEALLHLLAVISVALGLFNLLPIPLVDGGHIFLSLVEFVMRKPLSKKLIQTTNFIGLGIIFFIFIFATYSDIIRLSSGK